MVGAFHIGLVTAIMTNTPAAINPIHLLGGGYSVIAAMIAAPDNKISLMVSTL